jgi:hypothetical protein
MAIDIIHDHPHLLTNFLRKMAMSNEKPPIELVMKEMQEHLRYRWCGGGWCACMGAANCSGGLSGKGFSKEDWEAWVAANPDPNPPKPVDREELLRVLKALHGTASDISLEDPAEACETQTAI